MAQVSLSTRYERREQRVAAALRGKRILLVDVAFGIALALLALDHVRLFLHADAFAFSPLDPTATTAPLYATVWVTQLAMPLIVFLTGVAACLKIDDGASRLSVAASLVWRGALLIALDVTVVSFGYSFAVPFPLFLQDLWALGCAHLGLAALVGLNRLQMVGIGVAILLAAPILEPLGEVEAGALAPFYAALYAAGPVSLGESVAYVVNPALPWFGVIAIGGGLARLFDDMGDRVAMALLVAAAIMLAMFVGIRGFEIAGAPSAGVMAFLRVDARPATLPFLLIAMSLVFVLMALLRDADGPVVRVMAEFGRAPLVFYLASIFLAHLTALWVHFSLGQHRPTAASYYEVALTDPAQLTGIGVPLAAIYVAWLAALLVLYPLCRGGRTLRSA
jgi:uncharacterized membrane protein